MTPNELIGAVAAEHLADMMETEPEGALRFCVVGFGRDLTSAIAAAANGHAGLGELEIHVPTSLAAAGLDGHLVSGQAAVNLRHKEPVVGKRAILFAIDSDELTTVGKSAEMLTRIDSGTIRGVVDLWVKASGLGTLGEGDRARMTAALKGLELSGVARTLESFADFVGRVAALVSSGKAASVEDALDRALPALRIPRCSGGFNGRSAVTPQEWSQLFRKATKALQPLLRKETEKGDPLDLEALEGNLAKAKEEGQIGAEEAAAIRAFLDDRTVSAEGWRMSQADLCEFEWAKLAVVFEGMEKAAPKTLGQETVQHFDDEHPGLLDDDERRMLKAVKASMREVPPEVAEFFHARREEIARNRGLSVKWEKLVFSNPETYSDFLEGVVSTIHRLVERADRLPDDPVILVELKNAEKKSFWEAHNARLNAYFKLRYRGIAQTFGRAVEFRLGRMTTHPAECLGERETTAKTTYQFKFEAFLMPRASLDDAAARRKAPAVQFVWSLPPQCLALALADDLAAIGSGGGVKLSGARIAREPISAKGEIQRIRLDDATTIRDAAEGSEGRLHRPGGDLSDLGADFLRELAAMEGGVLRPSQVAHIREAFNAFNKAYSEAVGAWTAPDGAGLASPAFLIQAEAYGRLLRVLREEAERDLCRERLWKPILSIGVAYVMTGGRAALVAPWHPLRMAEAAAKVRQAAVIAGKVVTSDLEDVEGAELFFRQACRTLSSPYWPAACIDGVGEGAGLLTATTTLGDYTLMEPPTKRAGNGTGEQEEEEALDTEAAAAAKQFARICEEYLDLLPHQRANFSVVLYNADSKDLPSTLADELSSKVERESDLRCDLLLSHDDAARTRRIYEQQNSAVGDDGGSSLSSEAARSFMSRLRVGFADADSFSGDANRAADLVLLQDVVARGAKVRWMPSPFSTGGAPPPIKDCEPPLWSRRCPVARGDTRAVSYLAAPLQPEAGQAYLDALHDVVQERPDRAHWLPAREVSFADGGIGQVIRKAHAMGDWVVSYDAMADRRLLENQSIRIIRHINDRDSGRNIVVSTVARPRLLLAMLGERLAVIMPAAPGERRERIAETLYESALGLSGQIVMRAARHGHHASELMGVVLSMAQARSVLGEAASSAGWFFLDDYSTWLGRKEGQVADLLAIAPMVGPGGPRLRLLVTESKFVSGQNWDAEARKSETQLYETVERLGRALNPRRDRIDRSLWLQRIGDLMIEGMEPFDGDGFGGWDLPEWSRRVRDGELPVEVLGMSHVFIHDDPNVLADEHPLKGCGHCRQRIFSLSETRGLLDALVDGPSSGLGGADWREALAYVPEAAVRRAEARAQDGTIADAPKGVADDMPTPADAASLPPAPAAVVEPEGASAPAFPPEVAAWLASGAAAADAPEDTAWLADVVSRLRNALFSYGMSSEMVGSRLTPNAALVRFKGSDVLTAQKVERRQGELLTTHAIEVINVLQAPGEVVVMVSRPKRTVLGLREMWRRRSLPAGAPEACMSLLLGAQEANGEMLYLNLGEAFGGQQQHGPHTLIAGETGSGKGVLVQNLLLDVCATNSPKAAKVVMIDPKAGVDFAWLKRMPHLHGGLLTTQEKAVEALGALVEEMERRYQMFAGVGANKIARYNKMVPPDQQLPVVFVFHDELADWMLMDDYRSAVSTSVNRLGVKARAAGIHLVFITQRPDKDALPMQLRANLTNRLVLKVSDRRNSELVLDESGAERLLGQGHLAAKLSGEGGVILAQVPFLDEEGAYTLADAIVRDWEQG
ncbi:DNA translocase FtsK [Azospirillum sp. RWY-5-1]|uniref:DNA translocase FtsK n=1 Tax=Azospirillum oleiclasticum TaxID=2735135 RepID=A0ABX2TCZ1_9PROT|nr:FtsK/SpoIIIE domain-containing protein [Azospirillum oleiclasticum]NYZ14803.1 DNA translocase FtsK [Azospirillum oleiclasticum]NYZ22211.1 DNA translocase FtsK [Azospirillum oleiclasticum]